MITSLYATRDKSSLSAGDIDVDQFNVCYIWLKALYHITIIIKLNSFWMGSLLLQRVDLTKSHPMYQISRTENTLACSSILLMYIRIWNDNLTTGKTLKLLIILRPTTPWILVYSCICLCQHIHTLAYVATAMLTMFSCI